MSFLRGTRSWLRGGGVAACLALSANPAAAIDGSISFAPHAAFPDHGATAGATISLLPLGTPSFFINFVIPQDYLEDGPVKITFYVTNAAGGCTARLVAHQLVRRRLGVASVNSLSGLSESNPAVVLAGATVVTKTVTLKPGTRLPGQRRGEAILLELRREADDETDTCSTVIVQAIEIRYPRS